MRVPWRLVWCQVARALSQLKGGDTNGSRDTAASLAATVNELGGNRFWSEIVTWWTGSSSSGPGSTTNWLDGQDTTRARWLAVLSSAGRGPA